MSTAPTSSTKKPIIYLAAADASPGALEPVRMAAAVANGLGGPAELHIVHVLELAPRGATEIGPPIPAMTELLERGRDHLNRLAAESGFQGRVVGHLAIGDSWREVVQMAATLRADLLVVGTAGRTGVARLLLGSVAEKVVRHAQCPVLIARPKDYDHDVPQIEPPCPECVKAQERTNRAELWCAQHTKHHAHGRLHYEMPPSFAVGSMLFRPEAGS